jgi:hypothetical protein
VRERDEWPVGSYRRASPHRLGTATCVGDANLDGKINVDDYGIIDFNVGVQNTPLAATPRVARLPGTPAFPPREPDLADGLFGEANDVLS